MTDYTPAKDRLLVALANDMHLHANADYVVEAARAVLEEEKGEVGAKKPYCEHVGNSCICDEYETQPCAGRELAELKRRVERAAARLRPLGWAQTDDALAILEGRDKP